MNKPITALGLYSLFLLSPVVFGQGLRLETLELRDGLSQNTVTTIAQDADGFIWFGTQDGLNRYDGYKFKIYKPDPERSNAISSNSIWALLRDSRDDLWIGTYIGLNKYNAKTDTFTAYIHNAANPQSLSNNDIKTLYEDQQGRFWVGTNGGGLNRFDHDRGVFYHYRHAKDDPNSLSNDVVNTLYQDRTGQLWVGTDYGLNKFDPDHNRFEHVGAGSKMHTAPITALHEDAEGNLWIGTDGEALFRYSPDRDTLTAYPHDKNNAKGLWGEKIFAIYQDSRERLWIGSFGEGLNRYHTDTNDFSHYRRAALESHGLSDDRIYALFEDSSGVLWIGTYTGGINKFDPYNFNQSIVRHKAFGKDQQTYNDPRAFLVDRQKNLWVGSESGGLLKTTPDGRQFHYIHQKDNPHSLGDNSVFSLLEDRQGVIWIGTDDGWLHRYDAQHDRFTRYQTQPDDPNSVRHERLRRLFEDHQGVLWVGVDGGGLHRFERDHERFVHYHHDPADPYSLSHNRVFSIYEDRQQNLWIATFGGGLTRFDREQQRFTHFRHDANDPGSISYDFVLCIYEDANEKVLWLGTDGGGIDRFDPMSGTFKNYNEKAGLANNTIYGILQDDKGFLWMSHNKGLSRFDAKIGVFKNYDESDGLQSNEFNGGAYYKAPDGKLYFGGINGYNAFYPHEVIDNPHIPPVLITDFQLFNQPVTIGETHDSRVLLPNTISETEALTLSYKDYVFSFEFVGLDYVKPGKNQYAYKMEGLEKDWNYVGNRRFVTYTTLPPGEYTFRVKAANNHGIWNETGASLAIRVTPPFWQTWWFRMIAVLLVLMIVFVIFAARVKTIKARNRILQREVKARTAELQHKTDELQQQKTTLEETLKELGETKDALIEAAHKAGMADTATGVLHNVGNLLNSVNTSAGVIKETLARSIIARFNKANELLRANIDTIETFITQDARGKKLLKYYLELENSINDEHQHMQDNAGRLIEKIGAIKEAIAAQQRYAKGHGFSEILSLQELIEDTLMLQAGSIGRHEITVKKNIDQDVPVIKIQKTKVVQILLNLYKNAKESMDEAKPTEKILGIELSQDKDFVYMKVSDTGLGIEKSKLQSIFAYGFTTKADGHGFGLHSCANYMTEMGGKMWAESGGIGKGACFILRFPKKAPLQENGEQQMNTQAAASLHKISA